MLTALTPGVSFSDLFTGMDYMSINGFVFFGQTDPRVQVTMVKAGSPAERAGFRQGDVFLDPLTFRGVQAAANDAQRGEKPVFRIKRGETEFTIEGVRPRRELVWIWYASAWDLVAGGPFIGIGLLLFATGPLVPTSRWRSIPVMVAGFGMAVGFAVEKLLGWGTTFRRLPVYWRWQTATGEEWYFQQSLIGLAAALVLATLAAAEIRKHLMPRPAVARESNHAQDFLTGP